jgi:hypothetical protein
MGYTAVRPVDVNVTVWHRWGNAVGGSVERTAESQARGEGHRELNRCGADELALLTELFRRGRQLRRDWAARIRACLSIPTDFLLLLIGRRFASA